MPQQPGAYRLGKAILDEIGQLQGKLEVSENGSIALNSNTNYMLTRDALLDATRSAGFDMLELCLIALLPVAKQKESERIK